MHPVGPCWPASVSLVSYQYLSGLCAQLTEKQVSFLEQHEHVHKVHPDSRVTIQQSFEAPNVITQANAASNLDRIDQPSLPLDGQYHYNSDGTGTNLYIVDTVRCCLHFTRGST